MKKITKKDGIDWNKYKREDGSIKLADAFADYYHIENGHQIQRHYFSFLYIEQIERMQLISNPEMAANETANR